MTLTDNECKGAKAPEKPRKLSDGKGLYLHVMPNGSKYWRMKYRVHGKEKVLALGVYPEVTLKEARDKAIAARKQIQDNKDPSLEKQKARLTAKVNAENTFKSLAAEWHENWKQDKAEKHAVTIWNRLESDVFPSIGAMPVKDISAPMILEAIRKVESRGAYDVARRIKQTCGQIFCYGVETGRAERDPTTDLRKAIRPYKPEHFPALEIKELPAFLKKLDDPASPITHQTRLAMKFLMLTFVRTSEMIRAEWNEFDFDEAQWLIPAAKMKMKRDHIVPLSRQALGILEELKRYNGHRQWVFPSMARPIEHMSNATLTRAIMRLGYKDKMSGHGFRALATTTVKEKLGYRHEVIDRQLAHAQKNKIVAAYDRAEFLDERKKMMQEYADYIEKICGKDNGRTSGEQKD